MELALSWLIPFMVYSCISMIVSGLILFKFYRDVCIINERKRAEYVGSGHVRLLFIITMLCYAWNLVVMLNDTVSLYGEYCHYSAWIRLVDSAMMVPLCYTVTATWFFRVYFSFKDSSFALSAVSLRLMYMWIFIGVLVFAGSTKHLDVGRILWMLAVY